MNTLWQTKLAAWIHDPAEKALVLLRDRVGHEHGTVARLRSALGALIGEARGAHGVDAIKTADRWASAADRPQFPYGEGELGRHAAWSQVRFAHDPAIIHPLSGESFRIEQDLVDAHVDPLKAVSLDHFQGLVALGGNDARLAFLALWRFGPETPAAELNLLWQVLPADTRVPDHSIWNHLDLVSALAGAHADDTPALLSMSFGPVQGFIAQARSTSDLWAGSHLLSSLVWEGLQTLAGEIGPDALVFPQLRGLAAVDAWLFEEAKRAGHGEAWQTQLEKAHPGLFQSASDANPLFSAALPNKFLAIVPKDRAEALARQVEAAVRAAALRFSGEAAARLFGDGEGHWQQQIAAQLDGFPEVHWAVADWPAEIATDSAPLGELRDAVAAVVPDADNFFHQPVWQVLSREIAVDGAAFYTPNPGIAYPAVFETAERALAASKATRRFTQRPQAGYRCTLCGEREWLTCNPNWLTLPPAARAQQTGNPWPEAAKHHRHGIKAGEHLCAICTTKRLWPTLFAERVGKLVDPDGKVKVARHVVSTHTLALATTLGRLLDQPDGAGLVQSFGAVTASAEAVALPRSLHRQARQAGVLDAVKRLPGAFEAARGRRRKPLRNPRRQAQVSHRRRRRKLLRADPDGRRPPRRLARRQRRALPPALPRRLAPAGARHRRPALPRPRHPARLPRRPAAALAGPPPGHLAGAQRLLDAAGAAHRRRPVQGQVALRRRRRRAGDGRHRRPGEGDAAAAAGLFRAGHGRPRSP